MGNEAVKVDVDKLDVEIGDPRVDKARSIIREAMVKMALNTEARRDSRNKLGVGSVIAYELASMSVFQLVENDVIPTMCVELAGDGILRLKCSIDFVNEQGVEITMRGLAHEMNHVMHPVFMRKRDGELGFIAEWMKDDLFKNQALEYWNNAVVMRQFGDKAMLDVGDKGEPIGLMDPDKAYAKYREFKKSVNEEPVSREQFVLSPEVCYGYLKEMPKPPKQRHTGGCSHGQGNGTAGEGDEPGSGGVDSDEAEAIMDQIFDSLMGRALRGDEAARDALLDVGEQLGGEGGKFWSDMGLGKLVGKPVPSIKVRFWEHFLVSALGSKLTPGVSMIFPKKLAGLAPIYEAMGSAIPLQPMGKETETTVWGFFDTSGSMPQDLVDRCIALAGQIEGCETKWHTFSTAVQYCEDPSKIEYSRGGTSFECVDEWIMAQDEEPDAVLIVTDGYAPEIDPSWADKAIWVITEGGSTWPEDRGMTTIVSDIPGHDVG